MIDPADVGRISVTSELVLTRGVPTLLEALQRTQAKGTVFFDQLDSLATTKSLDALGALLTRFPPGLKVVVASRSTGGLPLALLRSQGGVLELSTGDLSMNKAEVSELVGGTGVAIDDEALNGGSRSSPLRRSWT